MPGESARINGRKGGRPKGTYSKKTLEKMRMKKMMDQRILRASTALINSQLLIATGQTFLYKIEKELIIGPKGGKSYRNKKPVQVTSQWEIESYLEGIANGDPNDDQDPGATYYYMTAKEPNNEALKDLFNRVHGKPTETIKGTVEHVFSLKGLAARREQIKAPSIIVPNKQLPHGEQEH